MVRHRDYPDMSATARALARLANELALKCTPSESAFSVGAVIARPDGTVLGAGFSRQTGPQDHAEEAALADARAAGHELAGAHAYVSLEPCGHRVSKPTGCAQRLIDAGITRVYFTAREPPVFAVQNGLALLELAGIACIELAGFDDAFRRANAHLLHRPRARGGTRRENGPPVDKAEKKH